MKFHWTSSGYAAAAGHEAVGCVGARHFARNSEPKRLHFSVVSREEVAVTNDARYVVPQSKSTRVVVEQRTCVRWRIRGG